MLTLSDIWFSARKTPFIERYFCFKYESIFTYTSGASIISFLYLICEASTVLIKANSSISSELLLSSNRFHAPVSVRHSGLGYLSVLVVVLVDAIRGWRLHCFDRPYSCLVSFIVFDFIVALLLLLHSTSLQQQ